MLELYERTLARLELLRDKGYNLVVMWEYDWKKFIKIIKQLQKNIRKN